jgi:hypothetical protein
MRRPVISGSKSGVGRLMRGAADTRTPARLESSKEAA